jgi:hypothetical protein
MTIDQLASSCRCPASSLLRRLRCDHVVALPRCRAEYTVASSTDGGRRRAPRSPRTFDQAKCRRRRRSADRDWRSKHIRRDSFASDFVFRPRPAQHATTSPIGRVSQPALPRRDPPRVESAPLVASPFSGRLKPARPSRKNGAATSHPAIACRFALGYPFVSLAHASVTSLAAGVRIVRARSSRASAAPAPRELRRLSAPRSLMEGKQVQNDRHTDRDCDDQVKPIEAGPPAAARQLAHCPIDDESYEADRKRERI